MGGGTGRPKAGGVEHGPQGHIFVVSNAYKRRKMAKKEGCPVGWGGVPTGAGLGEGVTPGTEQISQRVSGKGWLGGARAREKVQALSVPGGGRW